MDSFDKQIKKTFVFLASDGRYTSREIGVIAKTIIYTIQRILTIITTDNDNIDSMIEQIDEMIDFMSLFQNS